MRNISKIWPGAMRENIKQPLTEVVAGEVGKELAEAAGGCASKMRGNNLSFFKWKCRLLKFGAVAAEVMSSPHMLRCDPRHLTPSWRLAEWVTMRITSARAFTESATAANLEEQGE